MDHRCITCHYLAKKIKRQGLAEVEPVTGTERKKMKLQSCELNGVESFHCYKQVWDERTDLGVKDRTYNFLEKERRAQCFFYPYKPNMSFETAEYLQQNKPQSPVAGPSLLGDRAWLLWIISAIVLTASIVYVLALRR